jgi:histidine triad (HIT) family protein
METIEPEECLICHKHRGQVAVAGGAIYEDELIFVSHAQLWSGEKEH